MKYIVEAYRYLDNAKDILSTKAKKEDGYYMNKKYIKKAGNIACLGMLLALDGYFGVKKKCKKGVDWYEGEIEKVDKKMLNAFKSAYQLLHLSMGYDGTRSVKICKIALDEAVKIIHWVETETKQKVVA